ncbi:IPExxxVDY family protein [Pollutibacter soli]|uniref:IPExxxVDY family protein n=1 Tax=Pollutibacter soli TaxID=3034157 RepID=UPI003013C7D1
MKLRIDNSLMFDEFFEGTRLLGIVAPVKGYQFCWQLNQILQVDFRINHDLEIQLDKKNRKYFFSIYDYNVPNSALTYFLYHNQFDGEYLLPEFKHLDYLWLAKGDWVGDEELNLLQQSIRTIPSVQLVMELTNDKIRNKGHLVF